MKNNFYVSSDLELASFDRFISYLIIVNLKFS